MHTNPGNKLRFSIIILPYKELARQGIAVKQRMLFLLKRVTAVFLLITFIPLNPFSLSVYAQAQEVVPAAAVHRDPFPQNPDEAVVIPAKFGRILESFQGSKGPWVVLVQDAHAVPDAQKSIQGLIDYLQKKRGLGFVAVEGAASELDPVFFRSFPDKALLKIIVGEYLDRGELAGSTAAALLNKNYSVYQGIENWELYEKGLGLYQKATRQKKKIFKKLEVRSSQLEEKKKTIYPKELLRIDKALMRFGKGRGDLAEVLKKLAQVQRPQAGTELEAVLEEVEGRGIDQSVVEAEVRGIWEEIRGAWIVNSELSPSLSLPRTTGEGRVGARAIKLLNQQYQAFRTGQVSAQSFALILKKFLAENPDLLPPNARRFTLNALSQLSANQKTLQDIEGTEFLKSFEAYASNVKASLLTTETQRALDRESRRLVLLEKLAKLELTKPEWEEVQKIYEVNGERKKGKVNAVKLLSPLTIPLSPDLKNQFYFYENAEQRDKVFFENLMKLMVDPKSGSLTVNRSAVLVAGGFHTEGVTQQLKANGISYLLIAPHMNSIPDQSRYKNIMQGDVSWKNYFRVENGKVDLYAAFVRAMRDKLLGFSRESSVLSREERQNPRLTPQDPRLLKFWRDQIIRDGVNQKRISQIAQYTAFLDEVAKDVSKPQWQIKVEGFIEGLRQLEADGQLTKQNVMGVLQPATMGASVSVGIAHDRLSVQYFQDTVRSPQSDFFRRAAGPPRQVSAKSEVRNAQASLIQLPEIVRAADRVMDFAEHGVFFSHEHEKANIARQLALFMRDNLKEFVPDPDSRQPMRQMVDGFLGRLARAHDKLNAEDEDLVYGLARFVMLGFMERTQREIKQSAVAHQAQRPGEFKIEVLSRRIKAVRPYFESLGFEAAVIQKLLSIVVYEQLASHPVNVTVHRPVEFKDYPILTRRLIKQGLLEEGSAEDIDRLSQGSATVPKNMRAYFQQRVAALFAEESAARQELYTDTLNRFRQEYFTQEMLEQGIGQLTFQNNFLQLRHFDRYKPSPSLNATFRGIVRSKLLPTRLLESYQNLKESMQKQGLLKSELTYDFSGADLATALLLTDAQTLRFNDALEFNFVANPQDYARFKEVYFTDKSTKGYSNGALLETIGSVRVLLQWELESLGARNIRFTKNDMNPKQFEVTFDWSYDGSEALLQARKLIYTEQSFDSDTEFAAHAKQLTHGMYLRKADLGRFSVSDVQASVLITFEHAEDRAGYKRIPLTDLAGPGASSLYLDDVDRGYADIRKGSVYVREEVKKQMVWHSGDRAIDLETGAEFEIENVLGDGRIQLKGRTGTLAKKIFDRSYRPKDEDPAARSEVRTESEIPRPPFANKEEFLVAFGIAKEKSGKDFTPQQMAVEIGYSSYKTFYKLLKKYGEDPQQFLKAHGAKVRISQKPMSQGFGDGDQERFLAAYEDARGKLGADYTPEQMAKALGYARAQSLRNRIRRYGFEPRSFMQERGAKVQRNWTEFVRDYEVKWSELGNGYSLDAIAKALGYKSESGLRTQITDAGHSVREFTEARGADLRKKEHEGGRLAFVRQMDRHYKVLGPDAIMEEYAAHMGYENMNSFNSALRRYKINFRAYIRSKGDTEVPLSTAEVGSLHVGTENFLRHLDEVLIDLPRNPGMQEIVRRMQYRSVKYFLKRLRDMGHPEPKEFIRGRSVWVHDRLDFELRVIKAVAILRIDAHPLSVTERFLRLTRALGFEHPFEFMVTVHQLQADLTKAGFSSALLRKADTLAWFVEQYPQSESQKLRWIRTLLRLEADGALESKAAHAFLFMIKINRPILSKGLLEEMEKLFHLDLPNLLGTLVFSDQDRKEDVIDFLVSTGNQKREFEFATGLSNPKPVLHLIEKYMPAYFAATGRQGEIPGRTPLTREFMFWLHDTGVFRVDHGDQSSYADVNRLANLQLFLPEDLPKLPENLPLSVSAQQELLKQYFLGETRQVPEIRSWIEGRSGALDIFKSGLQNPEAADLIESPEFSVQKEALAMSAEQFALTDILQRWGTSEGADASLAFLRYLEAWGYQSPDKNISEIARWLQREVLASEHGTVSQALSRKLIAAMERILPQGALFSRLMNAIALAVIHTEHLMPQSDLSETFLSLVQFLKKKVADSSEMQTAFNSWLLEFASLAKGQPDNQELQALYEKVISTLYQGIQIAKSGKGRLGTGPRRVRFVLQEQKFNIPEIKKRYDEHQRRQLQQQTIMAQMRGVNREAIDEWNSYVVRFIYKNYAGLLRSGLEKTEILNAAVYALSKMAYDFGYEGNVFEYLLRALKPEKNEVVNEAIRAEVNARLLRIEQDIEHAGRLLETVGERAKERLRYESQIRKREAEKSLAEAALDMQSKVIAGVPVEELLVRIAELQRMFDKVSQEQGFMVYLKWELSFLWREHKKTLNFDKPVRIHSLDAGEESAVLYETLEDSSAENPADRLDSVADLAEKSWLHDEFFKEVLSDLEREVLRLYYSKDPIYSYADIAYQLAFEGRTETVLTRERIHQIAGEAVSKIKAAASTKAVQSWNDFIELLGSPRNPRPSPLPLKWPAEPHKYVMVGNFIPLVSAAAFAGQDVFIHLESMDTDVMSLSSLEKIRSGIQSDHAVQDLIEEPKSSEGEKKSQPQFVRVKLRDGRTRLLNLNEVDWKPSAEKTYTHSLVVSIRSREGKILDVQEVQLLTKPDGSIHPLFVSSLSDKRKPAEDQARSEVRSPARTVSFATGQGELNNDYWNLLNVEDRAEILALLQLDSPEVRRSVAEVQVSKADTRSLDYVLKHPIIFRGLRLTQVQMKGVYVDEGMNLQEHTGLGRAPYDLFGRSEASPHGGLTVPQAQNEYQISQRFYKAANLAKGVFVKVPMGWGTFPHILYYGRPVGFVLMGVPEFMTKRLSAAEIVRGNAYSFFESGGRGLREFHVLGIGHGFLHPGNISSSNWLKTATPAGFPFSGLHDLDNAFDLDTKAQQLGIPASRIMVLDVLYAMIKITTNVRRLNSKVPGSVDLSDAISSFLIGYFSFLPQGKQQDRAAHNSIEIYNEFYQHLRKNSPLSVSRELLAPLLSSYTEFLAESRHQALASWVEKAVRRSEVRADDKSRESRASQLEDSAVAEEDQLIERLKPLINEGWESAAKIRYALAVYHAIRKDLERKDVRALYGGAGDDILTFLLITNAVKGVFIDRAYASKGYNWRGTPFEPVDAATLAKILENHWDEIEQIKYPWVGHRILRILKTMGVDKKDVYVTESDLGESEIHFVWKHPDDKEEKIRSIVLKSGDLHQLNTYQTILSEGLDIYLQIASEYLPVRADYLTQIAKAISDGGYMITNNFVMGGGESMNPSRFLAVAGTFSEAADFESSEMTKWFWKIKTDQQKANHVEVRKKWSGRSEVRQAAYAVVSRFKDGDAAAYDAMDVTGVIVSALEPFVAEIQTAVSETRLKESIEKEKQVAGYVAAIESAEPVYIDYIISENEIAQWKQRTQAELQKILEAARNVNVRSRGRIMTRVIVPDRVKGELKQLADTRVGDPVQIDILGHEARVYSSQYPESQKLGTEPATITITGTLIPARTLLNDQLASGEELFYERSAEGSGTAVSVYITAVLAVTVSPLQAAELLKQVGETGTIFRQRIKDSTALSRISDVADRLAEQFHAEFRFQQSA